MGKWIQSMHMKKGALHREMGVPESEKIPAGRLEAATHSDNPLLRRRANLAQTLKGFHHSRGKHKSRPAHAFLAGLSGR